MLEIITSPPLSPMSVPTPVVSSPVSYKGGSAFDVSYSKQRSSGIQGLFNYETYSKSQANTKPGSREKTDLTLGGSRYYTRSKSKVRHY